MPADGSIAGKLKAIFAVGVLLTIGGVLGSIAYDGKTVLQQDPVVWADFGWLVVFWFVGLCVLGLFLVWAKKVVVDIIGSRAKVTAVSQEPDKKVLVMGLSYIHGERLKKSLVAAQKYDPDILAKPTVAFLALMKNTAEYPDLYGDSWQQNVRAINAHRKTLEKIIVLPSEQSLELFDDFKQYIGLIFGKELEIEFVCHRQDAQRPYALFSGAKPLRDYNDYNFVYHGLRRALEQAGLGKSLGPDDVSIYVTSGTAIFSIAAAVLTLNSKIKFGYVTMGGEVVNYDAQIDLLGPAAL